jgi:hypothetical protein
MNPLHKNEESYKVTVIDMISSPLSVPSAAIGEIPMTLCPIPKKEQNNKRLKPRYFKYFMT